MENEDWSSALDRRMIFPTSSDVAVRQMVIAICYAAAETQIHTPELYSRIQEIIENGMAYLTERLDIYDKLTMEKAMVEPPKTILVESGHNHIFQTAERYEAVEVTRNGKKLARGIDWESDGNGNVILLGDPK